MAFPFRKTLAARLLPAVSRPATPSTLFRLLRFRSSGPGETQLVEVQLLEAEAGSDEVEATVLVDLVEEFHQAHAMCSAPSWLPFLPGSSYPSPPRSRAVAHKVMEMVGILANRLTAEERMSLRSVRGCPSSEYFLEELHTNFNIEDLENSGKSDYENYNAEDSGDELL